MRIGPVAMGFAALNPSYELRDIPSQCQTARLSDADCATPLFNATPPFPRRLRRPGDRSFISLPPPRGWRSADRRVFLVVGPRRLGRGAHLAIGALASRRSAVTVLGRASPALQFRHCCRHPREGLAAGALIQPWRRHPTSRTAVCRDATPAPPSGSSPETPLIERDVRLIRQPRYVVNTNIHAVGEKRALSQAKPGNNQSKAGRDVHFDREDANGGEGSQVSFRIDRRSCANSTRRNGLPMTANSSTARCRCNTSSA
jgi:hypothetical protein